MLVWLILILVIGAALAWVADLARGGSSARWLTLFTLVGEAAFVVALVGQRATSAIDGVWIAQIDWPWIPQLGIRFHLALDGLSLLLIFLSLGLGLVSVAASWSEITTRVGFFHFNVLLTLAGVIGVFLALDLILFFFFWELMLVPMYFLIAIWGHERRIYAATKFFLFTQGSGLLMLIAILTLFFLNFQQTRTPTFDYFSLSHAHLNPASEMWIMMGFFVAFAVKLPSLPFHTWLPDAHSEAPTAGSVLLAGLLLKTGAYGLLRFAIPLFPTAAESFAPVGMALGAFGILYGAVLSFAQHDVKRLIAYTSVSHLGFVLLGLYAWNILALQGAIIQILAHGVSTGALFVLAGALQERLRTRDMRRMGGLWSNTPRLAAAGLFFAVASLGLPGLGDFVGEFLVLQGAYSASPLFAILGALGLVLSTIYALAFVQRVFHGENNGATTSVDLAPRHTAIVAAMMAASVWLGLYPQPVFNTAGAGLRELQRAAAEHHSPGR